MKALVFGPSGSGKTYVANALHKSGINAFDGDEVKGLSSWYDQRGNKIPLPENPYEAISNHYAFLWSKKFLTKFLSQFSDVYLFGGSGNVFDMFDLFDKVYFLKVEPELQRERLLHPSRETPVMDKNENGVIVWGEWLEKEAGKHNIPFIDATLTPEQIFGIISK